jgi:hypothetical protein
LRSGPLQPGQHPLPDTFPFELRQCGQDVKLQLACWCRAVDEFTKRNERDAQTMEFFEHRDEMSEISAETVEAPTDEHIKASNALRLGNWR